MVELNGTSYSLCLLDTNAVSEIVKWPAREGAAFFQNIAYGSAGGPPTLPCISPFTILELRDSPTVLDRYADVFGVLPSVVLNGWDPLWREEMGRYHTQERLNPVLVAPSAFAPELGMSRKEAVLTVLNSPIVTERDHYWKAGRREILGGMRSLVANYPSKGARYTPQETREFVRLTAVQHLEREAPAFVEGETAAGREIDTERFPSLRAMGFAVFYKFYADRRQARLSDVFDIVITTALPYVDSVITEAHLAASIRKANRLDPLFQHLDVRTVKDLRSMLT